MSLPALELPNVRNFIRFRIFFHARYYYPIFAILFFDYGITIDQFTMLNVLWAITIVLSEVPSGALADLVGRRALLVAGAVLMFIEMAVLLVAPVGGGTVTLTLFAINRICSGLAEAMVSGADEALAYDSLKKHGEEAEWTALLEHIGKRMSITMGIVMVIGAVLYDPMIVNGLATPLGFAIPAHWLIRVPVALTLIHSLVVLKATWAMREPYPETHHEQHPLRRLGASFVQVWKAAKWLGQHRFVLFVILGGLVLDSVARQYIILNSEYYRLIRLPEFAFGLLSAGLATTGFLFAKANRYLADRRSPLANFMILATILVTGLTGVSYIVPYAGLLFVPLIMFMFSAVAFLQSHYINQEVGSAMRATMLSFRGLANNLGLALASQLYALLVVQLKARQPPMEADARHDTVFVESLAFFPLYFWVLLVLVLLAGRIFLRHPEKTVQLA